MGATLIPEYYTEKLNLFVAEAPIVDLKHSESTLLHLVADFESEIGFWVKLFGIYNIIPPLWLEEEAATKFCHWFSFICKELIGIFADMDPHVDNLDRGEVYLSNFPSGSGYMTFLHYAQIMNSGNFARYDYGNKKNKDHYGKKGDPPLYDLSAMKVPTALIAGSLDKLGDPRDVEWLYDTIKDTAPVVFYHEYYLGHASFAIAKDMSWFEVDVVYLLNQYATNDFATTSVDDSAELLQ